jgi:peptidoglycan LD-endopeptidase LytH
MAGLKAHARAVLLVILVVAVSGVPLPSAAVTRAQVEAACEDSREQLATYRAAQRAFEDAAIAFEAVLNEIAILERQQSRIQGSVENTEDERQSIQSRFEEQAVELYMQGGTANPGIILSASSVDEFLTTSEFLASAAVGGQRSIQDLVAQKGELERFQVDLDNLHAELMEKEREANDLMTRQNEAMEAEQTAYSRLSGRCKQLTAQYDAEQEAIRAAARQRNAGSVQVGPFICPFTPGRTSFINSWGYPRSGGRTHKGTDMFAVWNEPMYAVAAGVVYTGNSVLGGRSIWLVGSNGVAYYYAHLSGWNVSNGQRVSQGQTIGFNGDSGNARGGAPHLHFEIHPGGRGSPAVNPYPTLVAACR